MMREIMAKVLTLALAQLSKEDVLELLDKAIDLVEDRVEKSETKTDDLFLIPLLVKVREVLGVPDDDENEAPLD